MDIKSLSRLIVVFVFLKFILLYKRINEFSYTYLRRFKKEYNLSFVNNSIVTKISFAKNSWILYGKEMLLYIETLIVRLAFVASYFYSAVLKYIIKFFNIIIFFPLFLPIQSCHTNVNVNEMEVVPELIEVETIPKVFNTESSLTELVFIEELEEEVPPYNNVLVRARKKRRKDICFEIVEENKITSEYLDHTATQNLSKTEKLEEISSIGSSSDFWKSKLLFFLFGGFTSFAATTVPVYLYRSNNIANDVKCNTELISCTSDWSNANDSLDTVSFHIELCNKGWSATNSTLLECNANTTSYSNDLVTCKTGWSATDTTLTTCKANLAIINNDLSTCKTGWKTTNVTLDTCNGNLIASKSDLLTCTMGWMYTNITLAKCNESSTTQTCSATNSSVQITTPSCFLCSGSPLVCNLCYHFSGHSGTSCTICNGIAYCS